MSDSTPSNDDSQVVCPANIQWGDQGQPISAAFKDVYFSKASGIDETRHVFMQHNGLPDRWKNTECDKFTIGETGFGTGLNFLVAANAWLEHTTTGTLHFVSAEKYPLSKTDLEQALALWPELSEANTHSSQPSITDELLEQYPPIVPGIHRLKLANNRIVLTLMYGEASEMFASLRSSDHPLFHQQHNPVFDAWFLDGFAPSKNPEMWSDNLFQIIADLSQPDTTFSTFTAAGIVRRGLAHVGFNVEKVPGFGHKRDMLSGCMVGHQNKSEISDKDWQPASFNSPHQPPWYFSPSPHNRPKTAIVIGGGIAGCSTARALAERGISVTLIERHPSVGQEGSGNPQGILYPKLSTGNSPLARFGLTALLHASRYHRNFLDSDQNNTSKTINGQRCGVLVLPHSDKEAAQFEQMAEIFPSELVRLLTGDALEHIVGLPLTNRSGLFFPQLGWIKPPVACQSLVEHPLISMQRAEVNGINNKNGQWQATDDKCSSLAEADVMIIACGFDSRKLSQTNHLPLKKIRGQISTLTTTKQSEKLQTVLCGEGYIAPALGGTHTLGATYNFNETTTELRAEDHQTNLQQLSNTDQQIADVFTLELSPQQIDELPGRAAFRCTTPDYLPITGPAPNLDEYLENYQLLRKNARSHIPIAGKNLPGLYLNIGHGSRGLSYAPMCAELVASQICGEVPPLELDLRQAVHPGRFIIRDLKRNKV